MPESAKFLDALECFARHDVHLIVVGGVAAVLEGAPISTLDLDVLYQTTPANVERLARALAEMEATYRDPAGRQVAPDAVKLSSPGHHLLQTRFGPIDALGRIGSGRSYDDLFGRSRAYRLKGIETLVLGLEANIETKEEAGREKDRLVLPVLRRTLEARSRRDDNDESP